MDAQDKSKDGSVSIRKDRNGIAYKWVRLKRAIWQLLHVYIWETNNGDIPDGYCIWFKDRDTMNCNLENLELITRGEMLRRNRAKFMELPKDLQTSKQLLNKLNKSIYGKEQTE